MKLTFTATVPDGVDVAGPFRLIPASALCAPCAGQALDVQLVDAIGAGPTAGELEERELAKDEPEAFHRKRK